MPESPPDDETPWLWRGLKNNRGYGVVAGGGTTMLAHRFSYEHFVGRIPEGLVIRHRNDIPLDINPRNLLIGTRADNSRDMVERGRWNVNGTRQQQLGELHWRAKVNELTVRSIRQMRAEGATYAQLAAMTGISANQCRLIVLRKCWAHVV